jgi:hypothetical protein
LIYVKRALLDCGALQQARPIDQTRKNGCASSCSALAEVIE